MANKTAYASELQDLRNHNENRMKAMESAVAVHSGRLMAFQAAPPTGTPQFEDFVSQLGLLA